MIMMIGTCYWTYIYIYIGHKIRQSEIWVGLKWLKMAENKEIEHDIFVANYDFSSS